jgi:hypothetical protein
LVKTGGRLVKHARYYWLLLAESHLTRRLFGAMVGRIAALPVATGQREAVDAPKSGWLPSWGRRGPPHAVEPHLVNTLQRVYFAPHAAFPGSP